MHVEPRLHGSRNEGLGLDGPIVCLHVSERKAHKATESGSDGSSRVQDVLIWIVSRHIWRTPVATLLWEGQAPLFLSVTSEWVRPALNATPWQLDAESFLHLSLVYCNYISKCFIAVETKKKPTNAAFASSPEKPVGAGEISLSPVLRVCSEATLDSVN